MIELDKKIEGLVQPLITARNAFLVDIFIRQGNNRKTVQIFADAEQGITIDQCAEISRELAKKIEEQDIIEGAFDLEVSSPGLEKPLKLLQQYRRNIGKNVAVRYSIGEETKLFEGVITSVQDHSVTFARQHDESITINFEQIRETTVRLPW